MKAVFYVITIYERAEWLFIYIKERPSLKLLIENIYEIISYIVF